MLRYDVIVVLVPLVAVVALVLVVVINGFPTTEQKNAQQAAINTAAKEDAHTVNTHTRPICADSSLFRADVDGVMKTCDWISHKPTERCGTVKGKDNNGHMVFAKDACFESCDTGNCRRRRRGLGYSEQVGDSIMGIDIEESQDLN